MSKSLAHVFIASFNRREQLSQAVESVLSQTYPNFRLWLFDDASSDGSREICVATAKRFPEKVSAVVRSRNVGLRRNFNDFLRRVGPADVAVVHAHDDVCLPHRLEVSVDALASSPDVVLVYSDAEIIDAAGSGEGRLFSDLWSPGSDEPDFARRLFLHGNFVCATTVAIRGGAIRRLGLRVPRPIELCMDYYSWLLLAAEGGVARLEAPVTRYRVSAGQMSARQRETQREDFLIPRMAWRAAPALRRRISPAEAQAAMLRRARTYLHRCELEGDPAEAFWFGWRSLALSPSLRWWTTVARAVRGAQLARARRAP